MSILKINRNEDKSYNLTYCEMPDDDTEDLDNADINSYNEITLKPGQIIML